MKFDGLLETYLVYQGVFSRLMDYLVLENFLLAKSEQPRWEQDEGWKEEFELD